MKHRSGAADQDTPEPIDRETGMHRDEVRLGIARMEYPRVLIWTGSLIVVLSLLTYVQEPEATLVVLVLDLIAALVLLVLGFVMARFHPPGRLMMLIFSAGAAVLLLALLFEIAIDHRPLTFAYLIMVLTALGPTTLAWAPFIAVSITGMAIIIPVVVRWPAGHASDWVLVSAVAILVSAALLRTRLRSIAALADASELALRLSVIDELTGLLNRRGLQEQIPRLIAMSGRVDDTMFAVFVDIDGLKLANDRHGHAFGDEVITVAGHAVLASVRGGDLVARYGGDEIVVIGIGRHPDPAAFALRLDEQVAASGIDRAKWPGRLSAGFAHGKPAEVSVDELIDRADADMYGRRGVR